MSAKKDITALTEDQYHIFSYYPKSAERNFELYEIEMDAGCEHLSIGHSSNSKGGAAHSVSVSVGLRYRPFSTEKME